MALREFLEDFVRAAAEADRRFEQTRDAEPIALGIELWEQLQQADLLAGAPGELRVDAHLAASMLYERRHELDGNKEDLAQASWQLEQARADVVPDSPADLQLRMSTAAWRLARYRAGGSSIELNRAIAVWEELLETRAGALAAANLGRALLERFDLGGDPDDLAEARRLLDRAVVQMPPDHPARAGVELALRRT